MARIGRLFGDRLPRHSHVHLHEAFIASGHRFAKFLGRHIGMHKIGPRVIHHFQLVLQFEHRLDTVLHGPHGMEIRRATTPLDPGTLRRYQFIKQGLILAELAVQPLVISLVPHVDGPDQVHILPGIGQRAFLGLTREACRHSCRHVTDDSDLQGLRLAVFVLGKADPLGAKIGLSL